MDSREVTVYKCSDCKKVYVKKEFADDCCKPYRCEVCGVETPRYRTKCALCAEKIRFGKANKIKYSEYKAQYLWDERTKKYYSDIEEMAEAYAEYDNEEGNSGMPDWCYACTEIPFQVDIEHAIEQAEEDMYEDFEAVHSAVDLKELLDFVEAWNKKQYAKAYVTDYSTVVLLNE
jgi:hypothetical protein